MRNIDWKVIEDVVTEAVNGKVIQAIKELRSATALGLKEAKDAVDYTRNVNTNDQSQPEQAYNMEYRLWKYLRLHHPNDVTVENVPLRHSLTYSDKSGAGMHDTQRGPSVLDLDVIGKGEATIIHLLREQTSLMQEQNELLRDLIDALGE